jgi:hypothetical protein
MGVGITLNFIATRKFHLGLLLGSWCYLLSGIEAIHSGNWWPLLVGFILAWLLRFFGGDPGYR